MTGLALLFLTFDVQNSLTEICLMEMSHLMPKPNAKGDSSELLPTGNGCDDLSDTACSGLYKQRLFSVPPL